MNDRFHTGGDSVTAPARRAFAIIPHDSQPLPLVTKGLCVGMSGNIALRAIDSEDDVTLSVVAGQLLPIRITHIRATGTTASGLVGLS